MYNHLIDVMVGHGEKNGLKVSQTSVRNTQTTQKSTNNLIYYTLMNLLYLENVKSFINISTNALNF